MHIELLEDRRVLATGFYDSFEDGLGDHWQIATAAPEVRIAVRELVEEGIASTRNAIEFAQNGNAHALVFDTAVSTDTPVSAKAILTIDMSEMTRGILTFQHFRVGATQDVVPEVHQTETPGKGLSVSTNGETWYRLEALNGRLLQTSTPGVWQSYEFDLGQEFARINEQFNADLEFTSQVSFMFSHHDNRSLPQRGWAIDEVRIQDRSDEFDANRPRGVFHRFTLPDEEESDFYYRAALFGDVNAETPVLVSVHGSDGDISFSGHPWNWAAYVNEHLPEEQSLIVIAPAFVMANVPGRFNTHSSYAKLSWNQTTDAAADLALLRTVDSIAAAGFGDGSRLRLWGYSGGGQFVGRFTAGHPDRVAAAVVGGPSSQIYPAKSVALPYGFGANPHYPPPHGVELDVVEYAKSRIMFWVGQDDNDPLHFQLERIPSVDSSQGISRLQRAINQFSAVHDVATRADIAESDYRYELLVQENRAHGWSYIDLVEIYAFLFSTPETTERTPRVHSRIVQQPSRQDTANVLPQSWSELAVNQEYYMELWIESSVSDGIIEEAPVELFMDPQQAELLAVDLGRFGTDGGALIDSEAGRVRALGGARTMAFDAGAKYELLARVMFRTKPDSPIDQLLVAVQRSGSTRFRLASGETISPVLLPAPRTLLRPQGADFGIVQGEVFFDVSRSGMRNLEDEPLTDRTIWLSEEVHGAALFVTQVIEPDDSFGHGAYLTSVNPDVTLTGQGPNVIHPGIIASERAGEASTGRLVFGTHFVDGGRTSGFAEGLSEMRADFTSPTNRVVIDVFRSGVRRGLMTAFNLDDEVIAVVLSDAPSGASFETMVVDRPEADIAYVVVTGRNGFVRLDNLRFSSALSVKTNADGHFRIHAVPFGEYFINVQLGTDEIAGSFFSGYPQFETSAAHRVTALSIDVDYLELPPTIDPVDDFQIDEDFGDIAVALTGISFGGGPDQQVLVEVFSSNPDLFDAFHVEYAAPEDTGTVRLLSKQDAVGSTTIRVVVTDGGPDLLLSTAEDNRSSEVSFVVDVLPVNDPPQFLMESDAVLQESAGGDIDFTGWVTQIAPGPPTAVDEWATQSVSFSVVEIAAPLGLMVQAPQVVFDPQPENWPRTASLVVSPAPHAFGAAVYEITATDDDPLDPRSTSQLLTITIDPINDPPVAFERTLTVREAVEADDETAMLEFTAADLIVGGAGETPARPADLPPSVSPPFDESEQALRVVAFAVPGQPAVDAADLPGGSGTVLRSMPSGGEIRFVFAGGEFVSGLYTPPIDFNEHPVFGGSDKFTYVIEDDGQTTIPGGDGVPVFLPPERSQPAFVTLRVLPANDPPRLEAHAAVHLLEHSRDGVEAIPGWATLIAPGPPTALDELLLQSMTLAFVAELSQIPPGLFHADPQVSSQGTLTLFPAAHAVGSAVVVIRATDQQDIEGFVPRSVLATVTVNVHPVNDPPRLVPERLNTGDSLDADHAWQVTSQGRIRYTLREDNTRASGDSSEDFFIPLRSLASGGYQPIGLLDVFDVGPANEQDDGSGGGQTLSLVDDFPRSTHLGGQLTLGSLDGRPGLFYRPPPDANLLTGGVDHFDYAVTDDGRSYVLGNSPFMSGMFVDDPKTIQSRVQLRLNPVNDPPVFSGGGNVVSGEGDGLITIPGWAEEIFAGPETAVDEVFGLPDAVPPVPPQQVEFLITPVLDQWNTRFDPLFTIPPTVAIDGRTATLSYLTAPHANGVAVFDAVLVDDGPHDPQRGDIGRSEPLRFTITIEAVNDPPQFTPGAEVLVGHDRGAYEVVWASDVLPGPPGAVDELAEQTVAFELTIPEPGIELFAADGLPTIDAGGVLRFTPAPLGRGQIVIDAVAVDSLGGRSEPAELTITLADILDPPLVADDRVGTYRGEPLEIDLLAGVAVTTAEVDPDSIEIVSGPNQGELVMLGGGQMQYVATAGATGEDGFSYRIRDVEGRVSDSATVTILLSSSPLQNPLQHSDVDGDGVVTPMDALLILNRIARARREGIIGSIPVEAFIDQSPRRFYDTDGNGRIEPRDALLVLNQIARDARRGAGEASLPGMLAPPLETRSAALRQGHDDRAEDVIDAAPPKRSIGTRSVWPPAVIDRVLAQFDGSQENDGQTESQSDLFDTWVELLAMEHRRK